jgi:hypothetical protein
VELVRQAFDRLTRRQDVKVVCNIPILGRCIDLAYKKGRWLFSVEFKLHNWRRAIRQARDHCLAADFAYVCMPRRSVVEGMREAFRSAGVGLLFYNEEGEWPFEVIERAPRSKETWLIARATLRNYLTARNRSWV